MIELLGELTLALGLVHGGIGRCVDDEARLMSREVARQRGGAREVELVQLGG